MAPGSARRRRRDESEHLDNSDSERFGTPASAADAAKRPRRSDAAGSDGSESDSDGEAPRVNGTTVNGSSDSFQPGAIIRVSVENFVTYEKADFFPGPNLNMIIGPNGTGKSSLVSAICLGLGYSPKHMGRAEGFQDYVRNGRDTATIEIELKRKPKDRNNYVIKSRIRKENNSQKWWLNGKETTAKAIRALMQSLKIQVDNLCQFLPQDRVVEFAASTPIDLLRETLRAAAPQEMLEWQKQLQELHKDKKSLAEATRTDTETLKNLESRQLGLQADVDRIREREEIIERVKNLKNAHVLARYQEACDKNRVAKERRKEAENALRRLEEESGPSLEAVNRKQEYSQLIDTVVQDRKQMIPTAEAKAKKLGRDVGGSTEQLEQLESEMQVEKKGFDERRKDVASSRSKITSLQADLKNQPADFHPAEWNQKIRAEEHIVREMEEEQGRVVSETRTITERGKRTVAELRQVQADLEGFETQAGQQLNFMKKHFRDVADGWEWIRDNQDKFEKEVFGPPMVTCSVKDERYSDQLQSLLQNDDFTCFTAQTKNDHRTLANQLYQVMSLSVVVRTCQQPLDMFRTPLDPAETKALGLDGSAIDYLDGPQPVLAMLCSEKRLHLSGLALKEHDDAQYDRLLNNGKVNSWAAGKQSYTVRRRREYGPQAMTAVTKNIQPGRFWTSQPVDTQEKKEMERRALELRHDRDELKKELEEWKEKRDSFEDKKREILDKIDELKRQKSVLQREYQRWQSIPEKIESEERQRGTHESAMRDARKQMNDLRFRYDDEVVKRAEIVLRHSEAVAKIREAHHELLEAQIRSLEARSDLIGLKQRNVDIVDRLDREKQAVAEAKEEANKTKAMGHQINAEINVILAQNDVQVDLLKALADGKTPDEVNMEIEAEAANLELIHAANPNAVREFEKRAQEIERLTQKMQGFNDKLGGLDRQLAEVMSKWEPKLDELIAKINDAFAYNFEQISCAGEVRVNKPEDFDLWAVDIMVRFRENESLQQLTAQRQSGGERAVSTIFYLMALQSTAQSPFRVVDEINQGMDPRNERMVHDRMVEIACREHTSQYFLITPKLLTGLRYDPRMKVLCIASGEHMPVEGRKLDFGRCLKVQKQLMAGA